jgi:hypothetical protein
MVVSFTVPAAFVMKIQYRKPPQTCEYYFTFLLLFYFVVAEPFCFVHVGFGWPASAVAVENGADLVFAYRRLTLCCALLVFPSM